MTVSDLIASCRTDQANERKNSPYCFDLFRLALAEENDRAWQAIMLEFAAVAQSWVYRHPRFRETAEDPNLFVNEAFARLWQYGRPHAQAGNFSTLSHYLAYLKRCLHSAISDHVAALRRTAAWHTIDATAVNQIADTQTDPAQAVYFQEILETVWTVAQSPQEQLIVQEIWLNGHPPRALPDKYPEQFASAAEVNNIKRNLTKRLRRRFAQDA